MRPYQEDDGLQPALRNNSKVVEELVKWQTLQKTQGILIYGMHQMLVYLSRIIHLIHNSLVYILLLTNKC